MTEFIALFAGTLTLYYFYFLLKVYKGLGNLTIPQHASNENPFVTVIISARNEEKTIADCLASVLDQDYPKNRYEVVVVDDGSGDRTCQIVQSLRKKNKRLRLLSLPAHGDETSGRKPEAISMAIKKTKGDIILTTDADCVVRSGWIRGMAAHFEQSTALVAGPVVDREESRLFAELARLEFLGLITTAAGLIGSGKPMICNGANLAYRRSAFLAAGGFGGDDRFSDDETLMQRINMRGIGSIVFSKNPDTIVITRSPSSLSAFLQQRIRWASKKGHYEDRRGLTTLVLLYFYFATLLLFSALALLQPKFLLLLAFLLVAKVALEYAVLSKGAFVLNQRFRKRHFFIAELFHVPYIVVAAFLGRFAPLQWRGRKLKR